MPINKEVNKLEESDTVWLSWVISVWTNFHRHSLAIIESTGMSIIQLIIFYISPELRVRITRTQHMCLQVCHLLMNESVNEFILYTNRISYGIAMMCWYWFSSNTNLLSKVIGGLHFADFIGSLLVSLKQNDEHDSIRNTPCPALLTCQIWKYNQDNQNNYALEFPSTSQLKEKEKAQFWQGKSEEFDCRDQLCNLAQIGSKSIFQPEWAWNLTDGIVKQQWTSSIALATICVSFHSHPWIQTGVVFRKRSNQTQIIRLFCPCDLAIGQMTSKTIANLFYAVLGLYIIS